MPAGERLTVRKGTVFFILGNMAPRTNWEGARQEHPAARNTSFEYPKMIRTAGSASTPRGSTAVRIRAPKATSGNRIQRRS